MLISDPTTNRSSFEAPSIGRDEMNLVEFPIALLNNRASDTLRFQKERSLRLADGSILNQQWTVTGDPAYGLPQPADEDVLLGLLKVASDSGFQSPQVHFTRRSLLQLIQWPVQGWSFQRFQRALARIKTTSILAKDAFWDNANKVYRTRHFGIIDAYQVFERRHNDKSTYDLAVNTTWVRFSNEFFESIQAGYVKPLNLGLYFSLEKLVSKRLFRYLDKKRYQKQKFEINLMQLATVHLGLSDSTCQYPSWIKKELDRAHQELIACNFLKSAEYQLMRDGQWKVTYLFPEVGVSEPKAIGTVGTDAVQELVQRGVSPRTAGNLVATKSAELVLQQIQLFDQVVQQNRGKSMKNPSGFLVKAIEGEWLLKTAGLPGKALVSTKKVQPVASDIAAGADDDLEKLLSGFSPEIVAELRAEAMQRVRKCVGHGVKLYDDSPVLRPFLADVLKERNPG